MAHPEAQDQFNILDYWQIACQAKWWIMGLVLVSVLVTGIISKLSPKLYEAEATIYPIQEDFMSGGGFSFGGGKEGSGQGSGSGASMALKALGGGKENVSLTDIVHAMLNSRLLAEAVVEHLNLMPYYGTNSKTSAANALRSQITVNPTPHKALKITVLTEDPKMAADIANRYFMVLDQIYKEHTVTAVKRDRRFIEERLAEKAQLLAKAENALKEFQMEHKLLEVSDQSKAAMVTVVGLHGRVVELQVELAGLREFATSDHPRLNQLQVQIRELRRVLDKMEQDPLGNKGNRRVPLSEKVFPAILEAPSLILDMFHLTREIEIQEAVFGMLIGMLEQAKIFEARDVPTIQILDVAILPTYPSQPRTLRSVLVAGALSLVFGILLAFFLDYLERLKTQKAASLRLTEGAGESSETDSSGNGNKPVPSPSIPKEIERLHG